MTAVGRVVCLLGAFVLVAAFSPALDAQRGGQRFRRVPPLPFPTAPVVVDTLEGPIRVVPMVAGLENAWSLAFLPNGDMLVTEKEGRLRLVRNGRLVAEPITGTPEVVARGQGGLLEVALHPSFPSNQVVYLTYSKAGERGNTTALARGRLNGMAIEHAEHPPRASGNRDSASLRERPNETGRLSAATEFREKVRQNLENSQAEPMNILN